jgi:tetratricopeptide (TPR) repeat protein
MRGVVDFQKTNWAPEVSHVWDANEQLAEMLILRGEQGDMQLALESYETALGVYPFRYNSLAGAARCAEELGDDVKASRYYGDLLTLAQGPFPDVTLSGIYSSTCGEYLLDRRPDLVSATNYFNSFDREEPDQDTSSDDVQLSKFEIAILLFLLSVSFLLGYLLKSFNESQLCRGRDAAAIERDNRKEATPVYDPLLTSNH